MKPATTLICSGLLLLLVGNSLACDEENNLELVLNLSEYHQVWKDRIKSVSTSSPLTNYFRHNTTADGAISDVFDYIETLWGLVKNRREINDPRACNLYSTVAKDWSSQMKTRVQTFQIGEVDDSCFSKVNVRTAMSDNDLKEKYSGARLRKLFKLSRDLVITGFRTLNIAVNDSQWGTAKGPFSFTELTMRRSGQTCTVDNVFAHQRNKVWYLRAAVTNYEPRESKPDHQRIYLQEFIPRNGSEALISINQNIETGCLEKATTVIAKWGGTGYAIEGMLFDDPISPLSRAYQRNLVAIDLASDAITPSNVAILALPMAMNLIPVAFVADLHALGMFLYVIVTDIFSTIPFLIKGIELIQSSQPTQEEIYAFFSGNETLGSMQSWVVKCNGESKFRNVGIVFVAVAIIALSLGIVLELWAKRFMYWKRVRAKDSKAVDGPFGKVALDFDQDDSRRMSHYEEGRDAYRQENQRGDNPGQAKRRRIFGWTRRK